MTERGAGWTIETRDGFILLRFNHKPDGRTLARLRPSRFTWGTRCYQQCGYAAYADDTFQEDLAIAGDAETWESVGEDPPGWLDDADYPFFHREDDMDDYFEEDEDEDDGPDFADPGGRSALRAASEDNPRNLPCPTCDSPNRLTPADVALGYQCDACADRAEGFGP